MDTLIYWLGRALIALIQALPLTFVARLGRAAGGLAYWLDARHRRVALKNLAMCFGAGKIAGGNPRPRPGKFPPHRRKLRQRHQNLRDELLRNCVRTSNSSAWSACCRRAASSTPAAISEILNSTPGSRTLAPGYPCAATYRALNQPALNRLMEKLRDRSGCLFFERRTDGPVVARRDEPAGDHARPAN